MAGTMSAPPMIVTAAPISFIRSAASPTVRYFSFCICAASVIGFLNQPSGCVGIGPVSQPTTLTFRMSLSSSL